MGAGMSLVFPSLALIVVRRVDDRRRGAAMGAFTSFFDLGVGLGAPFAGLIASVGAGSHYPAAFYAGACACALGACIGFVSTRGIAAAGAVSRILASRIPAAARAACSPTAHAPPAANWRSGRRRCRRSHRGRWPTTAGC